MVMIHGRNLETIHKELAIQYIFSGAVRIPKFSFNFYYIFLKSGFHVWTVSVSKTTEINRKQAQCDEVEKDQELST